MTNVECQKCKCVFTTFDRNIENPGEWTCNFCRADKEIAVPSEVVPAKIPLFTSQYLTDPKSWFVKNADRVVDSEPEPIEQNTCTKRLEWFRSKMR